MDSLDGVVKVEVQAQEPLNIRGIFSKCGEITASDGAHYFIKFGDNQSLQRALNLKVHSAAASVHVYMVASNPLLIDQFRAVCNRHQKTNLSQTPMKLSGASNNGVFDKRKKAETRCSDNTPPNSTPRNSFAQSGGTHEPHPFQALISSEAWPNWHSSMNTQNEFRPKRTASNALLHVSHMSPLVLPRDANVSAAPNPRQLFAPLDPRTQTPTSPLLSVTHLSLSFCGENITYDLKTLEPDPRFIIELLKTTDSERGSWMMVGAYYRRLGNYEAAITVIRSMVEAMNTCGISDDSLKPVFLFLSGCETDLAKCARSNGEHMQEDEHHKHSRMWLQKVYGDSNAINISSATRVEVVPFKLTSSKPGNIFTLQPDPGSSIKSTASDKSQTRILEREIQSLRDRRKQQSDLLVEVRVEKRKLEEDLMIEREFRRRVQRHLDEAEKELRTAQRMEIYTLDQVKREVDARRRAEELAKAEKTLRLDLARILEQGSFQPSPNAQSLLEDTSSKENPRSPSRPLLLLNSSRM